MQEVEAEGSGPEWYSSSAQDVLDQLQVTNQGLSAADARQRLLRHGENRLPETKGRSALTRFLLQFHNILIYVLLGSALLTAVLDHWLDTAVILAVVLANAVIGYLQEGKAEKAMDAIRHLLAPQANVIRDGERQSIPGHELVPGDIVLLEAGDKVPADLRLLSVHGMSAQEAILTGESLPVDKNSKPVAADADLGDRACMMFSGTLVSTGQGRGVVVATGASTEIGRISGLISTVESLTTPLVTQMAVFARWLTLFILVVAALLLVFGYFVIQYPFTELFMAVVGLSVAAIPEGLPAVLTITLAIGVQAMARRNAIVRRLPAIETLGSISVICTDKTGTLTRNEMMVATVLSNQHRFTLEGDGYKPEGTLKLEDAEVNAADFPSLQSLARAAGLCNDASLRDEDGAWHVEGDPMEGALLAFAAKLDLDIAEEQTAWSRSSAIPFDPEHQFMATLNCNQHQSCVFVKGAPERILAMCHDQMDVEGNTQSLDTHFWNAQAESVAASGQRVLAFARMPAPASTDELQRKDIDGQLTLLGMVGMIDPPRKEAISAIEECHDAGIRVIMITGDHAKTAAAIGQQIGLQNADRVLTGAELNSMDEGALREAARHCDIFARTSPEHKLRLVTALQAEGMTVAMTGDGVNDAPALKRADAGIAMGRKGSEAAKEASDLVLADDNFASIVAAIREGRTVYDNIKKVISWTLPTSAGEAMTIIVALLFGMTLPVTPIQILWINLITTVTLGLALAFEPTEANTMQRPPRPRNEALLTRELVWQIFLVSIVFMCGVFGIYFYALDKGHSIELARTLAVNTLVVMEMFHLFYIRNLYGTSFTLQALRGTKVVWLVVAIITIAQFAITYLPPLQTIFATTAVPLRDGMLVVGIGLATFVIIELQKQLRLVLKPR